jgi:putative flippase GtrA
MKALAPKEKLATRAGLAQFLRFGLVGVANTATSYIVIRLLAEPLGVPAASAIGYAAGVVQSFVFNRFWTFSNTRPRRNGRLGGEAVRFITVNLACGGQFTLVNSLAESHIGLLSATLAGVAMVTPLGFILKTFYHVFLTWRIGRWSDYRWSSHAIVRKPACPLRLATWWCSARMTTSDHVTQVQFG